MQSPFAGVRAVASSLPTVKQDAAEPSAVKVEVYYRALPKKGFNVPTSKQRVEKVVPLLKGWSTDAKIKAEAEAHLSRIATEMRNEFVAKFPSAVFPVEVDRDTVQTVTRVEFAVAPSLNQEAAA